MTSNDESQIHILPLRQYLLIGSILITLTIVTVLIAQINFGEWNLAIAMVIAGIKASLVALYFMHLRYDNKLYGLFFVTAIGVVVIFMSITMIDTLRRGELSQIITHPIREYASIYDDDGNTIPMDQRNKVDSTESEEINFEILHGYGPLTEEIVVGEEIDTDLALLGLEIFEDNCVSCHELDEDAIGPLLRDVAIYRSPTFIMNMILDPQQNIEKHPDIMELRVQFDTVMTFQNISEEDARALLEYLRDESEKEGDDEDFIFE